MPVVPVVAVSITSFLVSLSSPNMTHLSCVCFSRNFLTVDRPESDKSIQKDNESSTPFGKVCMQVAQYPWGDHGTHACY